MQFGYIVLWTCGNFCLLPNLHSALDPGLIRKNFLARELFISNLIKESCSSNMTFEETDLKVNSLLPAYSNLLLHCTQKHCLYCNLI